MMTLENQDVVHRPCCPEKLQAISEADLDRIAPRTSVVRPSLWRRLRSRIRCSRAKAYSLLLDYIPVLRWLPRYPVRDWLLGDFVSGISVGIIQLPQGLAYSLLAGLPPIFGLYTSFYPVLIYFLLGTSRHISVGTFAVVCVMIGSVLESLAPNENFMLGDNSTSIDIVARDLRRVEISMALAFLVGLFQIALGLIQFGFVVNYLSDPLISGYTTASAVHVLVSQLKYLFGIRVSQKTQPLSLISTIIKICSRIRETNIGTLVTSIIAIVILLLMKFLNGTFASKLVIPVPIEMIMLIVSTGISYGVDLYKNFGIENVGHIPVGLKLPLLPDFSPFRDIVGNAFAIAVVSYAITISLGKVFASKHSYKVDSNQELIAIGFSNFIGSFFQCFAISASVSRSLVQESTGGNSQVASAIASLIIFIIILRAGELFQDLPKAILASIIIVNLKGMFNQFSEVRVLWRSNRIDLLTWLVTFAATILLNMDIGLAIAVAFSLLTIIFRTQLSNFSILGQVYETRIYRDVSRCHQAKEIPRIKIFHSSSTVYYANADQYLETLYRKCGVDVERLIQKKRKAIKKKEKKELKALKKAKKENEASQEDKSSISDRRESDTQDPRCLKRTQRWYKHCLLFTVYLLGVDITAITGHDNIAFDHLKIGNFDYAIQENKEQETTDGSIIIVPNQAGNEESGGKSALQSLGLERPNFHSLILDFSSVNFVDTVCVKVLRKIFKSFAEIEVDVYLAGCNATVIKGLEDGNLFNETITKSQVFPSIHDAVTYLTMDHDQISIHETNGAPETRL